jgi:predicted nucleic-acid-binding Zn-ribbon protein
MIYTFHAGDYARLERADGTLSKTLTGYVFSYERSGRFHSFIFKWDDGTQTGWSGNIEDLPQNFTRIGKYDFALIRGMLKNCGYAEMDELDKMSYTKAMMMPENLHEGDFVETVDGRVGYIKSICRCEKCRERGFYEPTVHFTDGEEDCITKYEAENGFKGYKRIGRWENEKAVVQKPKEILHCGSVRKSENGTMRYAPDTQVMQDKINELVDAVNELRKEKQK